ncbi:MAG: hypothetical protein V4546_03705 [Bacteroidota bacterium]
MVKKIYKNISENQQKVSEPLVSYQTKCTIKIFKSFEEAKQDELDFIIKQSPIERLRQTVNLILKVYKVNREELKARNNFKKIKIIKG